MEKFLNVQFVQNLVIRLNIDINPFGSRGFRGFLCLSISSVAARLWLGTKEQAMFDWRCVDA